MSRGKRKGAPAPALLPVPRVRLMPPDNDDMPAAPAAGDRPAPPRRAPLARKRRSRFVF